MKGIIMISIMMVLLLALSYAEAAPEVKKGQNKKVLQGIVTKMMDSFKKKKKETEDRLFNLYKQATIAKIKALQADADADYAEQIVASSERLLKSLELYSRLDQRKLGLDFLLGKLPNHPGEHCAQIQQKFSAAASGMYMLRDGTSSNKNAIYKTSCEMKAVGGGWTLFAVKGSGFDVNTLKNRATYLNEDYERELLVEGGVNNNRFPTLSLERFDKIFSTNFEILAEIRNGSNDETAEYVKIISSKKSVSTPSTSAEGLLSDWKIEKGTHCNIIPNVGKACRVHQDGSEAKSAKADIVPMDKTSYVSFYIRP